MEKNHEIIDHLIRKARAEKASDIHISEGMPIWQRVNGHLQKSDWQMEPEQIKEMLLGMLNEAQREAFYQGRDVDFSWETSDGCRQRVNIFCQQKKIAATRPVRPHAGGSGIS